MQNEVRSLIMPLISIEWTKFTRRKAYQAFLLLSLLGLQGRETLPQPFLVQVDLVMIS